MHEDKEKPKQSAAPDGVVGTDAGPAGHSPARPPPAPAVELATDPVVEAYKRDVDRTLLRQNLRRSVTERVANLIALQRLAEEARRAGGELRNESATGTPSRLPSPGAPARSRC